VAAKAVHGAFRRIQDVDPVEGDPPACTHAMWQQLHGGKRGHRLARAGFTHKAHDFASFDTKVDASQDGFRTDRDTKVLDMQQAHRARLVRGSIASRKPSPRRFSPSTVSTMARPGKSAWFGATTMRVCASNSMRPQDGIGGCAPSPRYESPA